MTFNLSERQIKLLDAIISEYLSTSEPVGSNYLVKKYNLTISPATVRNEMAELLRKGFLEMNHSSAGRVPTSMAYKFFLQELLEEEEYKKLYEHLPNDERPILMDAMRKLVTDFENQILLPLQTLISSSTVTVISSSK